MIVRLKIPVIAADGPGSSLPSAEDTVKLAIGEETWSIRICEVVDVTRFSNGIVVLDILAEVKACSDDPGDKQS